MGACLDPYTLDAHALWKPFHGSYRLSGEEKLTEISSMLIGTDPPSRWTRCVTYAETGYVVYVEDMPYGVFKVRVMAL